VELELLDRELAVPADDALGVEVDELVQCFGETVLGGTDERIGRFNGGVDVVVFQLGEHDLVVSEEKVCQGTEKEGR